ncbi:MAG: hypothetical protein JNL74_02620, partial [Fibrobacteres bacterium]|nr:hypothetical protein [Fibrobacterota bacterium]
VLALYISLQKKEDVEEEKVSVIHTSGIYSVIRKSPRDNVHPAKPTKEAIAGFLGTVEKDLNGDELTETDRQRAAASYAEELENSIKTVEEGDRNGIQRFVVDAEMDSTVCQPFKEKKYFLTREDVYRHPELLPPFFAGCRCRIVPDPSAVPSNDLVHYRIASGPFPLPGWRNVLKV